MPDLLEGLPPQFRTVRYDGARTADGSHDLTAGANCQRYAYAVLAQLGIDLPPWYSSDLWADADLTLSVDEFEPLDLLLFSADGKPFGAHVAVYAGDGRALHLAKSVGHPALWTLSQFLERPEYRVLIGAKRALRWA
jgi:lipoprotein Spr